MGAKHLLNLTGDHLRTLPIVILYLTDGCNSRCVMCDIWRNPRRNMSMELVETIAADLKRLAVKWVVLSGGEAMQHPQWPEIARRLRAEGVRVILLTNGLLLRRQIDEVLASVDEVVVSLDAGTAATYEAIRGVDAFDLVLDGMRAVRAGDLPVTTRTTVQRANYAEIPQIIEVTKAADVNAISFLTVDVSNPHAFGSRLIPVEQQLPPTALLPDDVLHLEGLLAEIEVRFAEDFASHRIAESPEKLRQMIAYFRALYDETARSPVVRCNAPHLSTVIEVDGSLRPCYFLPTMGSLKVDALPQAINGSEAVALRRAYRNGERPECERCVCPLYKGGRALLQL